VLDYCRIHVKFSEQNFNISYKYYGTPFIDIYIHISTYLFEIFVEETVQDGIGTRRTHREQVDHSEQHQEGLLVFWTLEEREEGYNEMKKTCAA
jgi:hypothetical protein